MPQIFYLDSKVRHNGASAMRRLRIPFWTKKSVFKLGLLLALAPWSIAHAEGGNRVLKVELIRSPCFGLCPVYKVAIESSGRVNYEGIAYVSVNGSATGRVSAKSYARVVQSITRIDFKNIDFSRKGGKEVISSNDEYCPSQITDLASMTITVFFEDLTKTISHNLGCSGLPKQKEFVELSRLIDREANTQQWIKRSSETSKK